MRERNRRPMSHSTMETTGIALQLNMPTTSVRDLVVHGNDLVAATYGRAFWILDDLTPLRQINSQVARGETFLYRPEKALRVRLDLNQDTPLPPEMPAGQNPPDGALIDYYLNSGPARRHYARDLRRCGSAGKGVFEQAGSRVNGTSSECSGILAGASGAFAEERRA